MYLGIIILVGVCLVSISVQAQISIVVGKSSTQKAEMNDLKQVFSGTKVTWSNGSKVQVADQAETEAGKKFYDKFIGKTATQVRTQWMKLVLSGQASAPVKCGDDAAVKKVVADNPNAVGYISTAALDGTVKEIGRID